MSYFYSPPPPADEPERLSGFEDDDAELLGWELPDEEFQDVDLEHSELDRRLRSLVWPSPPPGVRERVLHEVLRSAAMACPPPPAVHPVPPGPRHPRIISEQVQRYELTRRQLDAFAWRSLRAPRREPRFASAL